MPRILTNCPTTGSAVPTGRRTQDVDIATMGQPLSFRCPSCQEVHAWGPDDAIIEEGLTPAGLRATMQPLR